MVADGCEASTQPDQGTQRMVRQWLQGVSKARLHHYSLGRESLSETLWSL